MKYILAFYSCEHGLEHQRCYDNEDLLDHLERYFSNMSDLSNDEKRKYLTDAKDYIRGRHFDFNVNIFSIDNDAEIIGEYHIMAFKL